MRIWIDFSNSPHPLLFAPIARRLRELGHEVLVTARDHAQTVELARRLHDDVEVIGGESAKNLKDKGLAITRRVAALRRWARAHRPDVALSHNSYAQITAAAALRTRTVTAMDFEHQPANHLAFRLADVILLPEAISTDEVRRQGATPRKVRTYPGLKEELYLGDFQPSPRVLEQLGIARNTGRAIVVLRTPPSRAMYHRLESRLFMDTLQTLGGRDDLHCVLLARHPEQARVVSELELPNLVSPESAIDSRSLMYASDLVVGGGGTMTREAALMGIPTVSVFAGRQPAVDRWLEGRGLLRRVVDPRELARVSMRTTEPRAMEELAQRGRELVEIFIREVTGGTR